MKYPWKRYWCPRDGKMNLADDGFLYPPRSDSPFNFDVVPIEKIDHTNCLALLGEPGMGKSTAIKDMFEIQEGRSSDNSILVQYSNLSEFSNESRLIDDVFKTKQFSSWRDDGPPLYLFIDSLDECRMRITTIAMILVEQLRNNQNKLSTLFLRIACRTAEWPPYLEKELPILWKNGSYHAYELTPLQKTDVVQAAKMNKLDPEKFLRDVKKTETAAFANKPLTLKFLIQKYQQDNSLPRTRRELYEQGCELLCTESSTTKCEGNNSKLSSSEKLAIASRIAAISVFCNITRFNIGDKPSKSPEDSIHIDKFIGGHEKLRTTSIQLDKQAIKETLETGLFNGRGSQLLGFAHKSYADYLASRYLETHSLSSGRILTLLQHPDDVDKKIVPQLSDVTTWLALTHQEVFDAIMASDPLMLLKCESTSLSNEKRDSIIEAILEAIDSRAIVYSWESHDHYAKLEHPKLDNQLRRWIINISKSNNSREAAINIAIKCNLSQLSDAISDIALNNKEEHTLRDSAARAISILGTEEYRKKLKPLALDNIEDDPNDQLKGQALKALWPNLITADELFNALTPRKQRNLTGSYEIFLRYELTNSLQAKDLRPALNWLCKLASNKQLRDYEDISDAIIELACQNLNDPNIINDLATTYVHYHTNDYQIIFDPLLRESLFHTWDDPQSRRVITTAIVSTINNKNLHWNLLRQYPILVRDSDFEWCAEQLSSAIDTSTEECWANLLWSLHSRIDATDEQEIIYLEAQNKSSFLCEKCKIKLIEEIQSRETQPQQNVALAQTSANPQAPQNIYPSPKERIETLLSKSENGDTDSWCQLLLLMTLEETSTHYGEVPLDIRISPGWQQASVETRNRILDTAEFFLKHGTIDPDKWLREPHNYNLVDISNYIALVLLKYEKPDAFMSLSSDTWKRHLGSVLCSPKVNEQVQDFIIDEEITARCYEMAQDVFLTYLPKQIDAEDQDNRFIACTKKIRYCWDDRLKERLHQALTSNQHKWKVGTFSLIAQELLEHKYRQTLEFLTSLVKNTTDSDNHYNETNLVAAKVLIHTQSDAAWSIIWPVVIANINFGRKLLLSLSHDLRYHSATLAEKLTESELGKLYIWLVKQFPYNTDPVHPGVYSPTEDDSARMMRGDILTYLVERGTIDSITVLEKTCNALPELEWLHDTVALSKENTRRKTWIPLKPDDFTEFIERPESPVVRNASELQDMILKFLQEIECQLHDETPEVRYLWNQLSNNKGCETFRPKGEEDLSDWIKNRLSPMLQTRKAIVGREIQIRRKTGSNSGERIDLYVSAIVPCDNNDSGTRVNVIIETKGCWNSDLKTAMEEQLVNRYLKDNKCRHGIYLVGWYKCDLWDNEHDQKKKTPNWAIEDAREFFAKQALTLSSDVTIKAMVIDVRLQK